MKIFIKACDCDSRLNEEQKIIIDKLIKTIDNTTIELPIEIKKKGTEAIVSFVENTYVNKFKEF